MSERVSEAFTAIVDWSISLGAKSIKDLPGCWEHELGEFKIAVNGHGEPMECSEGLEVEPYGAIVTRNGWPYAMLNAGAGVILAETPDAEDYLIEVLRKATP